MWGVKAVYPKLVKFEERFKVIQLWVYLSLFCLIGPQITLATNTEVPFEGDYAFVRSHKAQIYKVSFILVNNHIRHPDVPENESQIMQLDKLIKKLKHLMLR
jgi:hypothetical protein